jgi:hypothetical protein
LKIFSYVLQFDMHFICTPMWTKFYSCEKWVLQEHIDVFHLVGGQLLEHLLISHALSKSDNNRSIGDTGDGVSSLGEPLDEGPQ